MKVLARFYVQQIISFAHSPSAKTITLQPVTRGEENKSWAQATPSGSITLNVNNGTAGQWFAERLGQDVVVTFEDSEDAAQHGSAYTRD